MLSLSTPCLLRKSIKNIPFKPCCCSFSSALPRLNNNASGGGGGVPKSHQSFSPVAHSGDYQAITGNALGRDGQTRYEVDFHETLEWVAKLAQRMREDGDKLLAIRKPFTPPSLSLASDPILCLETTRSFTYDFTKPPQESHQREVVLRFRVSDVVFPTTETKTSTTTSTTNSNIKDLQLLRRHKFLLLAGGAHQEFYDPHTDVVTWRKNGEADGMDELDNKIYLVEAFHKVLNETMSDDSPLFDDVPLDLRDKTPAKVNLQFPTEWLKSTTSTATDVQ